MRGGNFPSRERKRNVTGEKGSEGRMEENISLILSHAMNEARKEWELRERGSNCEGNVDVVEEIRRK